MYATERHRIIVERARQDGRVEVGRLAAALDVTPETVRRDLTALEDQGLLRRVHGGAIPIERLGFERGVNARSMVMTEEKTAIARAALAELPEEGAILLDAGTTTAKLAELVPGDRRLDVVTNSLPIAMGLLGRPNLTVHTLGGRVRGRTLAEVETWALRSLADVFCDVAFVGSNGVSVARGLTTPDPSEAAVKRAMIGAARRVVVLADHSKMDNDCFVRFGQLSDVDVLITDAGVEAATADTLAAAGPKVIRA
jgi:DeoR family fructose operon transcriptional repressor